MMATEANYDEEEVILKQIDTAIEDFKSVAKEAHRQLLMSLESAVSRAQRNGDLEKLNQIEAEKSAFDIFGVVPASVSTNAFDRRMTTARNRLVASYESAIESLTRLGTVDAAREAQQDLNSFRTNGLMKSVEIELLDNQLSVWRAGNTSPPHWSVRNGILRFHGARGEKSTLYTRESFRNFSFRCEWRIGPGGDSGIFLRGVPQVQIWDHTQGNGKGIGSGGLFNNRNYPNAPTEIADKPIGRWNSMKIVFVDGQATVWLNGHLVTDKIRLENYPKRGAPFPTEGPIGLQAFRSPIEFRNLMVLKLP